MPGYEHRSPGAGVDNFQRPFLLELLGQLVGIVVDLEKAIEQRQDGLERIATTEVGNDLLFDLTVLSHRADDADIFVDRATRAPDLNGSDKHDA